MSRCLEKLCRLDGNRDELVTIRISSEVEQRRRDGPQRRKFLGGSSACWAVKRFIEDGLDTGKRARASAMGSR